MRKKAKDTNSHKLSLHSVLVISNIEEALRKILGIEFGKLSFSQTEFKATTKMPHGQMLRKTVITEIVRDGKIIKKYEQKGVFGDL